MLLLWWVDILYPVSIRRINNLTDFACSVKVLALLAARERLVSWSEDDILSYIDFKCGDS